MTWGGLSPGPYRLGGTATEGWAPEQHARFCADLVAASRVAPLASWSCEAGNFEFFSYYGMNGSGLEYAPTIAVDATGTYSFTWPTAVLEDEYGIQEPIKIRHVLASAYHDAVGSPASVVVTVIARGVQVRVRDIDNLLVDRPITVTVW